MDREIGEFLEVEEEDYILIQMTPKAHGLVNTHAASGDGPDGLINPAGAVVSEDAEEAEKGGVEVPDEEQAEKVKGKRVGGEEEEQGLGGAHFQPVWGMAAVNGGLQQPPVAGTPVRYVGERRVVEGGSEQPHVAGASVRYVWEMRVVEADSQQPPIAATPVRNVWEIPPLGAADIKVLRERLFAQEGSKPGPVPLGSAAVEEQQGVEDRGQARSTCLPCLPPRVIMPSAADLGKIAKALQAFTKSKEGRGLNNCTQGELEHELD